MSSADGPGGESVGVEGRGRLRRAVHLLRKWRAEQGHVRGRPERQWREQSAGPGEPLDVQEIRRGKEGPGGRELSMLSPATFRVYLNRTEGP